MRACYEKNPSWIAHRGAGGINSNLWENQIVLTFRLVDRVILRAEEERRDVVKIATVLMKRGWRLRTGPPRTACLSILNERLMSHLLFLPNQKWISIFFLRFFLQCEDNWNNKRQVVCDEELRTLSVFPPLCLTVSETFQTVSHSNKWINIQRL